MEGGGWRCANNRTRAHRIYFGARDNETIGDKSFKRWEGCSARDRTHSRVDVIRVEEGGGADLFMPPPPFI